MACGSTDTVLSGCTIQKANYHFTVSTLNCGPNYEAGNVTTRITPASRNIKAISSHYDRKRSQTERLDGEERKDERMRENKRLLQTETRGTPRKLSFHHLKGHMGASAGGKKCSERVFWSRCLCRAKHQKLRLKTEYSFVLPVCGWRSDVCCAKSEEKQPLV